MPAALYKSNLQVEKLVKPQEETGKRDRIDKAKFTGKVTSTMQQREERARSHMGVEWKITGNLQYWPPISVTLLRSVFPTFIASSPYQIYPF